MLDIAGHLQWGVPLGVFIIGCIRSATRKVVSYENVFLVFNDLGGSEFSDSASTRLGAARITLRNNSLSALENVRIAFDLLEVTVVGKFVGSTIGKIDKSNLNHSKGLELTIPEFPSHEIVILDVMYKYPSLLGFGPVSGGGNKYRICERELFNLERKSFWLQVCIFALISAFAVYVIKASLG